MRFSQLVDRFLSRRWLMNARAVNHPVAGPMVIGAELAKRTTLADPVSNRAR